jgi:hypothetical protein
MTNDFNDSSERNNEEDSCKSLDLSQELNLRFVMNFIDEGKQDPTTDALLRSSKTSTVGCKSGRGTVSFGLVRVHEHSLQLGDNPSVSCGLPVSLGWEAHHSETFDIETFEDSERKSSGKKPAKLSKRVREDLLRMKHTRSSMTDVHEEITRIKASRRAIEEEEENLQMKRSFGYKAPFYVRWFRSRRNKKKSASIE